MLSAKNGLPLFWLSLLTQDDLHGEWERDVRACYADPDECGDGLPPIRIGWVSARAMLAHVKARADRRVPTLAPIALSHGSHRPFYLLQYKGDLLVTMRRLLYRQLFSHERITGLDESHLIDMKN